VKVITKEGFHLRMENMDFKFYLQGVPPTSYYLFKNPYYDLLLFPLTKNLVES
jgi:hypothetical protein